MSILRRTLPSAFALTLAQGAVAQPAAPVPVPPPPPAAGLPSMAEVVAGILRSAVPYASMVVDLRYGSMQADPRRGAITLHDLRVNGLGAASRCTVTLGRLDLSGLALLPADRTEARLEASDLKIANNCFGANAATIGVATGGDSIAVSTLTLDLTQHLNTGAVLADLELSAPGVARIEASGDFDYLALTLPSVLKEMAAAAEDDDDPAATDDSADDTADGTDAADGQDDDTPEVGLRGTLRAAHLTVEDLGLFQRLKPLLPPEALTPEAIDGALITAEPGSPRRPYEEALSGAVKAFIAQPGLVTAEVRPATPITFDTLAWLSPDEALTAFAPRFVNGPASPAVALIADPAAAGTDARATGLAFARGEGVPRNPRRAVELLAPLAEDGEVALALADLTAATDPAAAYGHAQKAAAEGVAGGLAALDRIEAGLPTAALLAAQPAATTPLPDTAFASVAAMRDAALGYETGVGMPRSYALAWRLGSLAAAAGDGPSRSLLDRLEARFKGDPAWAATRDGAADQAAQDWTAQGLAARLKGE